MHHSFKTDNYWLVLFAVCIGCTNGVVLGQVVQSLSFFPSTKWVTAFAADPTAHRIKSENIIGSKDTRNSLGATIPVCQASILGKTAQLSAAGSVHFDVHPSGSAQVVSTEFYVDFGVVDIMVDSNMYIRTLAGHTSHHLSDNWYEKLQLTESVNYSRDYVGLSVIYSSHKFMAYAGANFGYIFHLDGHDGQRWHFQAGGEIELLRLNPIARAYCAVDFKCYQEAGFEFGNVYQVGVKIPMQFTHMVRIAYQFRHGIDERGQFFPKHRQIHTIGIIVEL